MLEVTGAWRLVAMLAAVTAAACPAPPALHEREAPAPPPKPMAEPQRVEPVPVQPPPVGPQPTPASDALRTSGCKRYSAAFCDKTKACKRPIFDFVYARPEHCTELEMESCLDVTLPAQSHATSTQIDSCLDAIAAAPCESWISDPIPECRFRGHREQGEPCSVDAQCKTGECQLRGDRSGCGTCEPAPVLGSACANDCGPTLECVEGKCVEYVTRGGACRAAECKFPLECFKGRCVDQLELGRRCDALGDTKPSCGIGLLCGLESNKCEATKAAMLGESCADIHTHCAAGSCREGICVEGLGEGAACEPLRGPPCKERLTCIAHRCVRRSTLTCTK